MSTAVPRLSMRLGLALLLAYRLEVVVTIASATLVTFLNWSLWTAICAGREEVAGMSAPELTTYVVVAWIITTFYGTRIDELVSTRVRSGDLSIDLVRPWSLQWHLYWRELGRSLGTLALATLPLALGAVVLLPLRLPGSPLTWLACGLSLLLAHALSVQLAWLVGVAAVHLRWSEGLLHLKSTVLAVFSGSIIPLEVYPEAVRPFIYCLPFQGLSHIPAQVFIERAQGLELLAALGTQAAWVAVLALAGAWTWRASQGRLVVQGG